MAFRFIFFTLLIISLGVTSNAQISNIFDDLGNDIKEAWNNVVAEIQSMGVNIGDTVSKWV